MSAFAKTPSSSLCASRLRLSPSQPAALVRFHPNSSTTCWLPGFGLFVGISLPTMSAAAGDGRASTVHTASRCSLLVRACSSCGIWKIMEPYWLRANRRAANVVGGMYEVRWLSLSCITSDHQWRDILPSFSLSPAGRQNCLRLHMSPAVWCPQALATMREAQRSFPPIRRPARAN